MRDGLRDAGPWQRIVSYRCGRARLMPIESGRATGSALSAPGAGPGLCWGILAIGRVSKPPPADLMARARRYLASFWRDPLGCNASAVESRFGPGFRSRRVLAKYCLVSSRYAGEHLPADHSMAG